jgi:hypothetical protein
VLKALVSKSDIFLLFFLRFTAWALMPVPASNVSAAPPVTVQALEQFLSAVMFSVL